MDFPAGFVEGLVDRAGGVADFQPAIPENVEDFVSEMCLEGLGGGRLRLRWEEKHHVDITEGAELAAPVATECHEGHRGRQGADVARVGFNRVVKKMSEQGVDQCGAIVGRGEAGGPRFVAGAQGGGFDLQEFLTGGQSRRDGHFAAEAEPVGGGWRRECRHEESGE